MQAIVTGTTRWGFATALCAAQVRKAGCREPVLEQTFFGHPLLFQGDCEQRVRRPRVSCRESHLQQAEYGIYIGAVYIADAQKVAHIPIADFNKSNIDGVGTFWK